MVKRYLLHERVAVRFVALLGIVALVFVGAWELSYLLLPEGMLRGRSVGQLLAGNDLAGGSVFLEWLRIAAINLGVMFLVVIASNLFLLEHGYPLGYRTVVALAVIYAVALGTDSFTLAQGGKISPTLGVLGRSGPYEIAAYVLAAAATSTISRYRLLGRWPKQTLATIALSHTEQPLWKRYWAVGLAILLLLAANAWEAHRIALHLIREQA